MDNVTTPTQPPTAGRTHGRPGTYTAGCRCDKCREAWRTYAADRRAS